MDDFYAARTRITAGASLDGFLTAMHNLVTLDDKNADELDLQRLLTRGRTHDFEKLPQVLWATTGLRIPNPDCYERLRQARNSIQHFCPPDVRDLSALSLEFIYTILDPLIAGRFGIYAIEHHEDHSVSYDYVVACLLRRELRFSIPKNFAVTEIDLDREIRSASAEYRSWFREALNSIGKADLLKT